LTHAKKGSLEQALKDFTSALNINPNYGHAYYNRGVANQKLGNTAAAKKDFSKAKVQHAKYSKDLAFSGKRFKNSSFKAQAAKFKADDKSFNVNTFKTQADSFKAEDADFNKNPFGNSSNSFKNDDDSF